MEGWRELRQILNRNIAPAARKGVVSLGAALLLATFISAWGAEKNQQHTVVPSVDAGRGPCTVDFRVTDGKDNPLAKAWIYVEIRYGFLGLRKIELQVPTNADGRARMRGFSYQIRRDPLEFRVQRGDNYKIIYHYPAGDCDAHMIVALSKTPRQEPATDASQSSQ